MAGDTWCFFSSRDGELELVLNVLHMDSQAFMILLSPRRTVLEEQMGFVYVKESRIFTVDYVICRYSALGIYVIEMY